MAKLWPYFLFMLWTLSLISGAIYLFSRGFLLSRQVFTEHNECIHLKSCEANLDDPDCISLRKVSDIFDNLTSSSDYCLPRKSRIILVVIDALKYEFGIYDKTNTVGYAYENKLPVFNEMMKKYPENTRFMKLVADAPTTTLQRLKGITTGSLPTFIDVGSNFATDAINEDNIIDQVVRSNMTTVFLGDSTWTNLYPESFERHYSFPSFDIYDLDTVDTAINQELPKELDQTDWSLLIAPYLGVDHCGHKYGPLHPEMARKLDEMNTALKNIIEKMDDETTLLVIGDHGMTLTGDHGGDTPDEINSMLFAFSKKNKFLTDSRTGIMDQIDLPPTIATILGTPIPFSNLGTTQFDIVPDVMISNINTLQIQTIHTWQNAKQMFTYFHTSEKSDVDEIPATLFKDYMAQFESFLQRSETLNTKERMIDFNRDVQIYLKKIADDCREIWATFEPTLISRGLILTALTTFFLFLLTTNLKFTDVEYVVLSVNIVFIYVTIGIVIGATPVIYNYFGWEWSVIHIIFNASVYSIALLAFMVVQNWTIITDNWTKQHHFRNYLSRFIYLVAASVFFSNSFIVYEQKVLCCLLCGLLATFLYKVREKYVSLVRSRIQRTELTFQSSFFKLITFTALAFALLRSSYSLHRCREEQGECEEFKDLGSLDGVRKKLSNTGPLNVTDLSPIVVLAIFAAISRLYFKKCGNLSGLSPHVLVARYGPIVAAFACSMHFFTTLTNSGKAAKGIHQVRIDALAWIVYSVFLIQLFVILVRPLMLFILRRSKRTFNVSPFGRVVPHIVMRMKQMYDNVANNEDDSEIPVVYGLATVYSSSLCSIGVGLSFVLAILLGPIASNGIFILFIPAALILVLNATHRYQCSNRLGFCLQPDVMALIAWHLLGHYSFYTTAHQPTLSQINWHAAFVGRTANYDHNNAKSAALVILNTFGSQLLIYLLYPLLLIAPTALYVICPSLAPRRTTKMVIQNQDGTKQREIVKNIAELDKTPTKTAPSTPATNLQTPPTTKEIQTTPNGSVNVTTLGGLDSRSQVLDIPRGELLLFEHEDLFFAQLYKVGTQFILLQSLRIFASMMACTILCRHLMVWKIFAPRFIFEAIATYVIFGAIFISCLIVLRIHQALKHLVSKMS